MRLARRVLARNRSNNARAERGWRAGPLRQLRGKAQRLRLFCSALRPAPRRQRPRRSGLGLLDPVVLLDAAVELQRLVDVRHVVVGQVGDLLELDAVELPQARRQIGVDALDLREIVGLALLLLEALPGALRRRARASERSGIRADLPRRPRR